MGTFLGNGYALWKPTWTLDGTTKIFQTAMMVHNTTATNANGIDTQLRTYWTSSGRPFNAAQMYIGYTLARTETYVMLSGVLTYDLNETAIVGTKASALGTPINTSILINKQTGIVGRHYRGRMMLPNMWIAEANVNQAGIIDSSSLSNFQALIDAADVPQATGPFPQVLGHTTSEILPTPLTALKVGAKVGSMPHRIRGF